MCKLPIGARAVASIKDSKESPPVKSAFSVPAMFPYARYLHKWLNLHWSQLMSKLMILKPSLAFSNSLFILAICLIALTASDAQTTKGTGSLVTPAYLDTSLTFQQRAADLVSRMTLREKISQMESSAPAISRLGMPAYNWGNECLHGVVGNGFATVFPQAIGMAATWDPKLIHEEADVISTEARAKYNYAISKGKHVGQPGLTFFAPNINIARDPRWGRNQETYGEDPYLTSRMGVAFVTGLQGNNPKYFKVIATPKHFDAHSGPELGRHRFDVVVSNRDLFDTYLPAFEAAVKKGGAFSVMAAYTALNGVPDCANRFLLTDILRNKWGFEGYVVSDAGAIWYIYHGHNYSPSLNAAAAAAVKAGCDLDLYGDQYSTLKEAVKEGLISEKDIDTAVTRLMLARLKLGMFDPPSAVPYSTIAIADNNTPAHMELARRVADESIVLLKNAHDILPLKKNMKSVAVIGAYADDVNILLGDYNGTPSDPVTILQGIKNKLGPGVDVRFAPGYNPLEDKIVNPSVVGSQYLSPANGFAGPGL
ncbi:MAG: glycoside hydrolase family 3 C-terminal domain-containing protein [Thaumarchaeota archaeon]|nr:glycoside hydrolase family 3 C-terminal domain-containing protein [Nitrososphaerota archaeon]